MKSSAAGILTALVLATPLTLFGLVVLAAAALRETPLFWHNAGGYSTELRALVLEGFYPALVIYFFWLLLGSITVWRMLRRLNRAGFILLLACAGNWLLLAVITTVVLWNNVENLLEGLPFHYHAS